MTIHPRSDTGSRSVVSAAPPKGDHGGNDHDDHAHQHELSASTPPRRRPDGADRPFDRPGPTEGRNGDVDDEVGGSFEHVTHRRTPLSPETLVTRARQARHRPGTIGGVPTDHVDLDHLAVAAESAWDLWSRYGHDLGGRFVGGGPTSGFHWSQARFDGGMKIEMLQPHDVEAFDFLRRFLDHSGPGPHHLTFKVPDLGAMIPRVEAAGAQVVGIDLESPTWKEAFLHPRTSHGIVVQLAQEEGDDPPFLDGTDTLPPGRCATPARLRHVEHLVADLDAALDLFAGPLAGEVDDDGADPDGRWSELRWPGPGRIRLVAPADDERRAWLADRPGRLHHVAFDVDDPAVVPDAGPPGPGGVREIDPARNLGVRLRLHPR
jgi:methylmalonyl-CoA/ethylmalonyl-CoA epimerase